MRREGIKKYIPLMVLVIYYCTKLLWDKYSFDVAEYLSILLIGYGTYIEIRKARKKELLLLSLFIIFSVYIVINGLILTDTEHLVRGVYEYIFYQLIFFSCLGYLKKCSINDIHRIIKVFSVTGVFLAALTMIEFVTKKPIIAIDNSTAITYGTNIGIYGFVFRPRVFTRSYLSHGLLVALFSLTNLYMYKCEKSKKWLFFSFICLVAVILTSSRGPLVAWAVGIFALLFDKNKLKSAKPSTIIRNVLIIFSIGVVIYVLFYSNISFGNSNVAFFFSRIRSIINWNHDAGNVGRIERWRKHWDVFVSNNVWLGSGVSRTGSSGLSTIMGTTESGVIKRLVELGIIGVVQFYLFIALVYKWSAKKKKQNNELLGIRRLAMAESICILVDDLTLQATEEIMVSFYLWFFLALLYAVSNNKIIKNNHNAGAIESKRSHKASEFGENIK